MVIQPRPLEPVGTFYRIVVNFYHSQPYSACPSQKPSLFPWRGLLCFGRALLSFGGLMPITVVPSERALQPVPANPSMPNPSASPVRAERPPVPALTVEASAGSAARRGGPSMQRGFSKSNPKWLPATCSPRRAAGGFWCRPRTCLVIDCCSSIHFFIAPVLRAGALFLLGALS